MSEQVVPTSAKVVVIGAGIVGNCLVGHLARLGWTDMVLLDNMMPDAIVAAVAARDASAPRVLLEASGGIGLEDVASYAATGVDRISIGALTHSAPAADLSLEVIGS